MRLTWTLVALGLAVACSAETGRDTQGSATAGAGASTSVSVTSSGSGGATPCETIDDCPANSECASYACLAGSCKADYVAKDTVIPGELVAGDCKQVVCDGEGNVADVEDESDVFNDGNPCTDDRCVRGEPNNPPANEGAHCGSGSMMSCVDGVCTGCNNSEQCPVGNVCQKQLCTKLQGMPGTCSFTVNVGAEVQDTDPTDCYHAVCDRLGNIVPAALTDGVACGGSSFCAPQSCAGGRCGEPSFVEQGTPVPEQVANDCMVIVCDGRGGQTMMMLETDRPPNPNECTSYECVAPGELKTNYAAPGTPCTGGVTGCDGNGDCV